MSNLPIQEFCVRNDCPCGSTIGPTISTRTGVRTIDAGMPQLSMHSCREVMGIADCKLQDESFREKMHHVWEVEHELILFAVAVRLLDCLCCTM